MPICSNCGTIHHEECVHYCLPPIEKGFEYRQLYSKVAVNEDGSIQEELGQVIRISPEEYKAIMDAREAAFRSSINIEVPLIDSPPTE